MWRGVIKCVSKLGGIHSRKEVGLLFLWTGENKRWDILSQTTLLYKYIIINEAVRRYPYIQNKFFLKSTISSLKHITQTQNNLPRGSIRSLNTSPCTGGKPHGREIQKDAFMSFNIREEPTLMSRSQNSWVLDELKRVLSEMESLRQASEISNF